MIVTAALDVFSKQGYHAASIRDIAKRAGMSTANLYHHFGSKQDLLYFIMQSTIDDLVETSRRAIEEAGEEPAERLRALVGVHVRIHAEQSTGSRISQREVRHLPPARQRPLRAQRQAQHALFEQVISEGIEAGVFQPSRPEDVARALGSMCTSVATWYRRRPGMPTPAQVAASYQDMALDLVGYRPAEPVTPPSRPAGRRSR